MNYKTIDTYCRDQFGDAWHTFLLTIGIVIIGMWL